MENTSVIVSEILRRRRAAIIAATVAVTKYAMHARRPRIPRQLFSFEMNLLGYGDHFFERLYRMPKELFYSLESRIIVHRIAKNKMVSCISPLIRLSCTIRWLAGGSYLDIAMAHHLAVSTAYLYINETINDLDSILHLEFPYGNREHLKSISDGFTRGRSPISKCCGALDGLAIKIRKPSVGEVDNALSYYNRKGFFSLNCQAVCDSSYRFTFVSCVAAGSTHDSTAFELSSLARFLRSPRSVELYDYWIACDDAYAGGERLVVPWSGRNLSHSKDCFNYWLSSARIFIEQCFGMLVGRWGIFWRPLRVPINRMGTIVILCCKLHNFIINEGFLNIYQPTHIDERHHEDEPDTSVHLQGDCDGEGSVRRRRRDLDTCPIRDSFTAEIEELELRRPYPRTTA